MDKEEPVPLPKSPLPESPDPDPTTLDPMRIRVVLTPRGSGETDDENILVPLPPSPDPDPSIAEVHDLPIGEAILSARRAARRAVQPGGGLFRWE
jgi:hypothetical protein